MVPDESSDIIQGAGAEENGQYEHKEWKQSVIPLPSSMASTSANAWWASRGRPVSMTDAVMFIGKSASWSSSGIGASTLGEFDPCRCPWRLVLRLGRWLNVLPLAKLGELREERSDGDDGSILVLCYQYVFEVTQPKISILGYFEGRVIKCGGSWRSWAAESRTKKRVIGVGA